MKNLIALITIVFSLGLLSCSKETIETTSTKIAKSRISSKHDFLVLCEANEYPFNLLSKATKEEFANSLVFVDGNFLGYTSNIICKELSFEQYYVFLQQILGANPVFDLEGLDNIGIKRLPYNVTNYGSIKRSKGVLINTNLPYAKLKPERCPGGPPPTYPCETCDGSCIE